MTAEHEQITLPQVNYDFLNNLASAVHSNGEGQQYKRGVKHLRIMPHQSEILGLSNETRWKLREINRTIPDFLYLHPYEEMKQVLEVGFSRHTAVKITMDHNINKPVKFEKGYSSGEGQNWFQFGHTESTAMLTEDPWIANVRRDVVTKMDQSNSPLTEDFMRGNLIWAVFQPYRGKSLHLLYHFDIHGETDSFRWLAYRTITQPGQVTDMGYAQDIPGRGSKRTVEIPNAGAFQFPTHIPVEQFTTDIIFPEIYYSLDPEDPSREYRLGREDHNYLGIQKVD